MPAPWYLYMIRCRNNALYVGVSTDVVRRFNEHQQQGKRCAKFLRGKQPLSLVFTVEFDTKTSALSAERRLKQRSKAIKEALVKGHLSLDDAIPPKT